MSLGTKLWLQIQADRRKVAMVGGLFCVAMLLWGRLLLTDVPRTVVADPTTMLAEVMGPDETVEVYRDTRPVVLVPRYRPVARDLFQLDTQHYDQKAQTEVIPQVQDKSGAAISDEQTDSQRIEAQVMAAAGQLKLQSTVLGERERAMINGELLEIGQMILGFELIEVASRQVTLVKDGIEVTLEM